MEDTKFIRLHVRWMIRRDMDEVLQIENDSFTCAWNMDDFLRCLRQRNCIGMVAEVKDEVVGFMVYNLHKKFLEISNFAVAPKWRREGVGSTMIQKLLSKLSSHRRSKIKFTVRETNVGAQLFFKYHKFKWTKTHPRYFDDTFEDAYEMQYLLEGVEELEMEETEDCITENYD